MSKAYYNEFDPYAAQWLRNLIAAGHIAPGDVDQRSIEDVRPSELAGYTQCHFFAGIGVWSYALRRAGWADSRPVWTGSCPCQPFSEAGKRNGFSDERHLWPAWFHLISQCLPNVIFGEQVAAADGLGWLDLVQADLEAAGYARGAVDLCAAGVGAPHIRQRLWIFAELADANMQRREQLSHQRPASLFGTSLQQGGSVNVVGNMGSTFSSVADSVDGSGYGSQPRATIGEFPQSVGAMQTGHATTGPVNGRWSDADWLFCRDGKWRPVEPGTFPLANGATARVGRLRAYGNAINAEAAEAVIRSYMECRP